MSSESAFIERLRDIATHPAARGLMDDAAVLKVGGEALVLTHDLLVEGVHFLPDADPADIAWKLVAVNLSDLAGKAAQPLGVLLGYMLNENDRRFAEGLEEVLARFNVPLLGGDVSSGGPPRSFGVTAIGRATHTPVPSRSGARPGDGLWITGPVGAAMMGFEALQDNSGADSSAYRRPAPRLAEGQALAPHVSAMMDVSDGVLLDAARMARASGVTIAIDGAAIPLAAPEDRRQDALRWGEDYELLFCASADAELPLPAHRIGEVRAHSGSPIVLDGQPLSETDRLGYEHQ
jgi:thiamine-monophosphate kinase